MTEKTVLTGTYRLYLYDDHAPQTPDRITGTWIPAAVPGDAALSLAAAGILPDPYTADGIDRVRETEGKDIWYVRTFDLAPAEGADYRLVLPETDAPADIFVNDCRVGECRNALIPHTYPIPKGVLSAGENRLALHFRPATEWAKGRSIDPYNVAFDGNYESLHIRRSAASYGWDILPRAVSAGIRGEVYIERVPEAEITDLYIATARADEETAVLVVSVNAKLPDEAYGACRLVVGGQCGDSRFESEYPLSFDCTTVYPYVIRPELWYPRGSGEQNLYDISVRVVHDGKTIAARDLRYGIRTAKLCFGDEVGADGDFYVCVNQKKIRIRGVDHTPTDVFHCGTEDPRAVADDIAAMNANLVRIWGGGVYERDAFYDRCDEAGILVWQDIMLACHAYPTDDAFLAAIGEETRAAALRLRNHSCLLNWCGSNETDWAYVCVGLDPNTDKVTRAAIPDALRRVDPFRDYLPSTPYFSPRYIAKAGGRFYLDLKEITEARRILPEEHYWWHRDDFLRFTDQDHRFIAEIGYSGAPSDALIRRYLPAGTTIDDDAGWKRHSFPTESGRMTGAEYLFSDIPDTDADRTAATRFYQAEAYKYIVEKSRIRPYCNGIVLWNLRDGYPIFASSLVDYTGWRKPAFHTVALSYAPTQCIFDITGDGADIYIVNDGGSVGDAHLTVCDGAGNDLLQTVVRMGKDPVQRIGHLMAPVGTVLVGTLSAPGVSCRNYAVIYHDTIHYPSYRKWYKTFWEKNANE